MKNIPQAEIKLVWKNKVKFSDRIKICSSLDIYKAAKLIFNSDTIEYTEEMMLFFLNRANNIIGFMKISSGGTAGTYVDLKVIFSACLSAGAHSLIICHNHPSGNINPSEQDIKLTHKIYESAKLLDMELLDHIIVTEENYFSFADENNLKPKS